MSLITLVWRDNFTRYRIWGRNFFSFSYLSMISIIYQLPSLRLRSQLFSYCFLKIKVLFYLAAWRYFSFSLAFSSFIVIFLGIIFFIFSDVAFTTLLESMAWCFSAVLKNYPPLSLQILHLPHSPFFWDCNYIFVILSYVLWVSCPHTFLCLSIFYSGYFFSDLSPNSLIIPWLCLICFYTYLLIFKIQLLYFLL